MSTPNEGFESAQFLTGWANSQIEELETLLETFRNSPSATVIEERNHDDTRNELKIRFKPVPHKVRGLANNIIKDMRDALDQAASAASHLVAGRPRRNAHFPFGESPDDFDQAITRHQCKHIPAALYPVLKGYEPYPSGEEWTGGNNLLRLLGRISGPHKHRFTLENMIDVAKLTIIPRHIYTGGGSSIMDGFDAKGDYVIFSLGRDAHADIDKITFTSFVAFADPKLKGIPLLHFVKANWATVSHIVQDLQAKALSLSVEA